MHSEGTTSSRSSSEINPYTGNPYSETYKEILETRKKLPVYEHRMEIIAAIRDNPIVIIEGQTGSGKTTQIPQFVLEEALSPYGKKIVCTQPRRVAAISIATRVAQEMDVKLGDVVGYSVRYDDYVSENTKLVYMTDGLLMREFISDPKISKYGVVIIDEAHERTVNTDIIIGILKLIGNVRPDLKIIIMSATLDAGKFVQFYTHGDITPPHLKIPGRQFNVEVFHQPQMVQNEITAAVNKCMEILEKESSGDILIFMTGEDEIERACSILRDRISRTRVTGSVVDALVFPLYAALPPGEQAKVFNKLSAGTRKVVVSTNIAETSVTIDGVVYVIDCGYVKQSGYSPSSRKRSLNRVYISKAAANQRKGRAGRTCDGFCYRMYTQEQYEMMEEQSVPEIQRSDLCSVILLMLAAHISDIVHFPFLDHPHYKLLVGALEELYHLDTFLPHSPLPQNSLPEVLSTEGKLMAGLPIEPKYAKALLSSYEYGNSRDIIAIVAILSEQGQIFLHPRNKKKEADIAHKPFINEKGDHLTLLQVYKEYIRQGNKGTSWAISNFFNHRSLENARKAAKQLERLLKNFNRYRNEDEDFNAPVNEEKFFLALLKGSFMNVAKLGEHEKYQVVTGRGQQKAEIKFSALETSLFEDKKWVIFDEFVQTDHDYLRTVSVINPNWLCIAAPTFYVAENFRDPDIAQEVAELRKEYTRSLHA
ncbi:hypothetical protein TVAG_231410 [Trichomonas vaginalis G3]|uniref:RNA helicase n=1 Tax=Trichomonas vaginalis (strain ATCC PRA-98 / G3) TaxID=412133 RepID=A2F2U1_TRIV3|nr:ATP-dependent RNA helicase family [Trichomonas vaginalis G3]EAY00801.1 hypothetical protein TVAG_231410 [Trichomonas vaginalis G3]KAI5518655.1 ATP-dependent RNA helicase family [Trichomonas vaginalis G3]|eukprot:XP_001313730.1 hypothetical protein [Trichomonas vaginalis G3]